MPLATPQLPWRRCTPPLAMVGKVGVRSTDRREDRSVGNDHPVDPVDATELVHDGAWVAGAAHPARAHRVPVAAAVSAYPPLWIRDRSGPEFPSDERREGARAS